MRRTRKKFLRMTNLHKANHPVKIKPKLQLSISKLLFLAHLDIITWYSIVPDSFSFLSSLTYEENAPRLDIWNFSLLHLYPLPSCFIICIKHLLVADDSKCISTVWTFFSSSDISQTAYLIIAMSKRHIKLTFWIEILVVFLHL